MCNNMSLCISETIDQETRQENLTGSKVKHQRERVEKD